MWWLLMYLGPFCKMDVLMWTTVMALRKLITVLLLLRNFCVRLVFRHSQLLRHLLDFGVLVTNGKRKKLATS
jgi:hypothetical protein